MIFIQDGILSPLLFIIYIHRLNSVLGNEVQNLQFADDLAVYCTGPNLESIIGKLNQALQSLSSYFKELNLDINAQKTKVVVFTKNNMRASRIKFLYDNKLLPVDDSVRFLGVIFTKNRRFNRYVDCLTDRATKATSILRSLAGTSWGADPKTLLMLFKSLVRSHFEYTFFFLSSQCNLINKLEKIQNKNLHIIMGTMISTPIVSMQVECRIPPISIRFNFLLKKFLLKLCSLKENSLIFKMIKMHSESHFISTPLLKNLPEMFKFKSDYN